MWQTTCWSEIISAKQNQAALKKLLEDYWLPVYLFIRRNYSQQDAEDLTQSFFVTFLEKNWIQKVECDKGRFRNFLLVLLKRFLKDQASLAQNRFEKSFFPKDSIEYAEHLLQIEPDKTETDYFQATWTYHLLSIVMKRLRNECPSALGYEILIIYFFHGNDNFRDMDLIHPEQFFLEVAQQKNPMSQTICQHIPISAELSKIKHGPELWLIRCNKLFQDSFLPLQVIQQHQQLLQKALGLYPVDILQPKLFIHKLRTSLSPMIQDLQKNLTSELQVILNSPVARISYTNWNKLLGHLNRCTQAASLEEIIRHRHHLEIEMEGSLSGKAMWRFHRLLLEHYFPSKIVRYLYTLNTSPSYAQLAQLLAISKSEIEKNLKAAQLCYKNIFKEEILRYSEETEVELEVTEILGFLGNQ